MQNSRKSHVVMLIHTTYHNLEGLYQMCLAQSSSTVHDNYNNGKIMQNYLKNERLPSWAHTRSTGHRATREKVRYCTVVIAALPLMFLFLCVLDMEPVCEFTLTVYMHPCITLWNGYKQFRILAPRISTSPRITSKLFIRIEPFQGFMKILEVKFWEVWKQRTVLANS